MSRDVNGVGRVRVVAPPYPTRWINIRPVPVSISVWVSVIQVLVYFFQLIKFYKIKKNYSK